MWFWLCGANHVMLVMWCWVIWWLQCTMEGIMGTVGMRNAIASFLYCSLLRLCSPLAALTSKAFLKVKCSGKRRILTPLFFLNTYLCGNSKGRRMISPRYDLRCWEKGKSILDEVDAADVKQKHVQIWSQARKAEETKEEEKKNLYPNKKNKIMYAHFWYVNLS